MNYEKILATRLEELRNNGAAIAHLVVGLEHLENSGVFKLLKLYFRPRVPYGSSTPQESAALDGAYSAGALDFLETLVNFKEMYLEALPAPTQPRMDFSSIETNLKNGNLTKEEADAIRNGTKPDYSKYYAPKSTGNSGSKPV